MSRHRKQTPESGLLQACLQLLGAERIWHCRMNTGAVQEGGRFFRFGRKGMADILVPAFGSGVVWIECKAGRGQQSGEQKLFQQEVEAEGHTYLVVRDAAELQQWVKLNKRGAHGSD
jgi:hypothetical protein